MYIWNEIIFNKKTMNLIKKFLPLLTLFVTSINFAQFTDVINSNRPGKSIAAFSVGKTVIQAELGFYGIDRKSVV